MRYPSGNAAIMRLAVALAMLGASGMPAWPQSAPV
jgi:hypothetical protein